jgi:glyoxylase-like metal-dependent hydrolase (beta-lactamase superfamily II)
MLEPRCIPLPTPFTIGEVNTYLLEGDPLTLIDAGPGTASAILALERGLAEHGYRVEDLELVVLTHQHVDHLGLVSWIVERSGADIACLDALVPFVEDFPAQAAAEDAFAQSLMREHGVSGEIVAALGEVASTVRGLAGSAPVARVLRDGDTLQAGGRTLTVHHRPGHSPTDTVFHDAEGGLLFSGDHLLSRVSSNALVTRGPGGDRTRPLLDYRRSLEATRALDFRLGLGGHGVPVAKHRELIGRRLERQDARAADLLALLAEGPLSAHEIATRAFGRVAFTETFLTLSEVIGHADLLEDAGSIVQERSADGVRLATVGSDNAPARDSVASAV